MLGKCCCLFPDRRSTGVTQVNPSKGIFLLPEWLLMAFVFLYLLIDFIVHNSHQNFHRLCEKEKFFSQNLTYLFLLCLSDRNTSVLRYCPTSDSWTVFRSCSAHIRKQQMLSVEDTIYLVGGYTHELEAGRRQRRPSQTEDVLTVQSYNVTTGEWIQLKENTSKSGLNLTCTLHNDGIYIMSRDVSLPTSLEHRVFLKYNIFSDAWEAFRRFPALGQNMLLCSLYLPNLL